MNNMEIPIMTPE